METTGSKRSYALTWCMPNDDDDDDDTTSEYTISVQPRALFIQEAGNCHNDNNRSGRHCRCRLGNWPIGARHQDKSRVVMSSGIITTKNKNNN